MGLYKLAFVDGYRVVVGYGWGANLGSLPGHPTWAAYLGGGSDWIIICGGGGDCVVVVVV
jgi:hypothetical protein